MRAVLLAGVAVAVLSAPALAQPAQDARDAVFLQLRQLQQTNLDIAGQMSEIQRRAAALLEATRAGGADGDPLRQEIIDALIANALTLASIVLAPVATQDAADDAFLRLLEQNLGVVSESQPLFDQDTRLAQAVEQYALMQAQTQDLGLALRDGWDRYAEAVAKAETAGLLPAGGFDRSARTWAIKRPSVEAGFAARAGNTAAAADEPRLEPETSALDHSIFGAVPDAEVAAALAREAERLAARAPEADSVSAPSIEDSAPEASTSTDTPMQVETTLQAPPATWMVMIGDNARAVAKAPNANAATTDRIRSLQIGCHPNGTLRYIFETDRTISEYLVYANKEQHAAIRAQDNIVSGSEAIHMSDVLRLAFEWATSTTDTDAHIMVAAGDDPEALAYFPVPGYLDARGRVLDGCLPWQDDGAGTPSTSAVTTPELTAPTPQAVESTGVEDALPAVETLAPVPRPRPASRMPVDLMNAG
jgi:hypothetical protein